MCVSPPHIVIMDHVFPLYMESKFRNSGLQKASLMSLLCQAVLHVVHPHVLLFSFSSHPLHNPSQSFFYQHTLSLLSLGVHTDFTYFIELSCLFLRLSLSLKFISILTSSFPPHPICSLVLSTRHFAFFSKLLLNVQKILYI